ncbi:MAG: cytochrome P450 [Candidatus Actinomarina sp.]|tara:strand:+ start:6119 stop:7387 length:1269 start_codon:yes stop_codon:yes gene_type:complete
MLVPKVPGLPIIGHSIPFQRNALQFTSQKQKQYGDIFEISLLNEKFIVMLTPESTKEIFLDKDDNFSSKEGWAVVLGKPFENGLMLRDFEDHKYHRSLLQDSFRHEAIHGYLEIIQPIINNWVQNLNDNKSFDLYKSVKQLMFDISLSLFFLDVKKDESERLNNLFMDSIASATSAIRWPLPFTKIKKGLQAREYLLQYFQSKSDSVTQDSKKTLFAELVNTNKGDAQLNNLEIAEHMIFLLLAAHDTTTITLTNSIYNLSKNKEFAYDLLNEANEIDHLDVSSLKNGIVAESVFKEAIRYYPPVPFSVRQVMRNTQIENYNITKDSYLTISPLLLHHDDRYWDDPQKFDPYRFIDPGYINHAYFPFAGGAHTCLGKFFASYLFKNVIYKYVQSIQNSQIDHLLDIRPTPIPHPVKDVKVLI